MQSLEKLQTRYLKPNKPSILIVDAYFYEYLCENLK